MAQFQDLLSRLSSISLSESKDGWVWCWEKAVTSWLDRYTVSYQMVGFGMVNAAYKQALLRFHPDRASRTDIRQQVEAEEKFKLISRLKEKLLPVSY
ncbi:hypothetical protein Taro_044526 [Colocasia esculenta]|uniref:J domain-containing protein n=1 Tax=Colocasia esculenta TaxID=4460 RepID=A0A843WUA0_COLES|nr:hypothetical protein [Colocasia esculenta]